MCTVACMRGFVRVCVSVCTIYHAHRMIFRCVCHVHCARLYISSVWMDVRWPIGRNQLPRSNNHHTGCRWSPLSVGHMPDDNNKPIVRIRAATIMHNNALLCVWNIYICYFALVSIFLCVRFRMPHTTF